MTTKSKKAAPKNCCPVVYWMRVVDNGGSHSDIAVRADSEALAWRFVQEPGTFQARSYTLLPTHPAQAGTICMGSPARPNGMFQPRWGFDADCEMSARLQYERYIHRTRASGVVGRTIWVAREMP